jgi:geranylgeranyl pyrophosphate synthase
MAATFYAFSLINNESMPLTDSDRLKLYEILYWEHYGCSIGTALDLGWSKAKLTEIDGDQYIQHIVYRSCAYTYRVAARIGALAGGAGERDMETIFNYSTQIGIAFQFIDDILNLVPETESWGKTIGEDITEGKRSPLILHTLKTATEKEQTRLLEILDSKTVDQKAIHEAISILKRNQAFTQIRKEAKQYIESACMEVDKLTISDYYKSLLKDFAMYVLERKI